MQEVNPIPVISSQVVVEQPKQSNFLVVLLSILLSLSVIIAGFFVYQTQNLVKELNSLKSGEKIVAEVTPEPTTDPTANWKTYNNVKYGFTFMSPIKLDEIYETGSVIYRSNSYQTEQLTGNETVVRIIKNWTDILTNPFTEQVMEKQNINGIEWYVGYDENLINEPGCFSAIFHTLTFDKKDTIEISKYGCPSDSKVKQPLIDLSQILSTFKFIN